MFPELADVELTHVWGGKLAATFDLLPHLGKTKDGLWYAVGYGGHGMSLATYLGTEAGSLIGGAIDESPFLGLPHPTRFYYRGESMVHPGGRRAVPQPRPDRSLRPRLDRTGAIEAPSPPEYRTPFGSLRSTWSPLRPPCPSATATRTGRPGCPAAGAAIPSVSSAATTTPSGSFARLCGPERSPPGDQRPPGLRPADLPNGTGELLDHGDHRRDLHRRHALGGSRRLADEHLRPGQLARGRRRLVAHLHCGTAPRVAAPHRIQHVRALPVRPPHGTAGRFGAVRRACISRQPAPADWFPTCSARSSRSASELPAPSSACSVRGSSWHGRCARPRADDRCSPSCSCCLRSMW